MPHAIIEYSDNLKTEFQSGRISGSVHTVLTESGLFKPQDIRTRAYETHDFLVGNKLQNGRFVHIIVYLMEGRTVEQKRSLSQSIVDRLCPMLKNVDFISADIRELATDVYCKAST
jgi:5-carboxymethyl-2-hydroxymuconate isomerase